MKRIDGTIGNLNEDQSLAQAIQEHRDQDTLETIHIESDDRHKSRLRVQTDRGTDVGLVVDEPPLSDGDVLCCTDQQAIVVTFETRAALAVVLPDTLSVRTAIDLGHRIGNQHWDIAIEDGTLYIPLTARQHVIEAVIDPYLPAGTTYERTTVDAARFHDHDHGTSTHGHGHDSHTHHPDPSDNA